MSDATQQGATVERLAGILDRVEAPEETPEQPEAAEEAKPEEAAADNTEAEQETEPTEDSDAEPEEDAQEETPLPTSLSELAETLGVEQEKLYDLKLKTKIDGVEGEATLAQILKSYQLEGHLNRKSMELADQRKAFEQDTQKLTQEAVQRVQTLEDSLNIATHLINERYKGINWEQLKHDDPVEFNTKYIEYQQHQQALNQAYQGIQAERQRSAQEQERQFVANLQEEYKKVINAIPEWANEAVAKKEQADLRELMKGYGFKDEEIFVGDHRHIQILRDAKRGRELSAAKPSVMKKVAAAPKLAKPGSKGSKADQDMQALKDLKKQHKSGNKNAGIEYLKKAGFV